uniref:Uncharacterized protein n=1 Tax=Nephroselmis olivacea TaxID=31312 RepID=Q9TKV1_NEPOL|nr:hypothetical protein NeolCp120 [Nephroselmis olivacea]AAD54896.1 unknown [Nephroselmis olivacea]
MVMDTRLSQLLGKIQTRLRQRWQAVNSLFPIAPFCMLSGFYAGNGFATTVKYIHWASWWEGITIFCLVLLLELLQRFLARPRTRILWIIHYGATCWSVNQEEQCPKHNPKR